MSDDVPSEVTAWLAVFAQQLGVEPPTAEQVDAVLGLAAVAARGSARQAAPVACWLAAMAGLDAAEARQVAARVVLPAPDA